MKGARKVAVKGFASRRAPVPMPKRVAGAKRPKDTRLYKKSVLRDPMEFTNIGFGNTGMTGED